MKICYALVFVLMTVTTVRPQNVVLRTLKNARKRVSAALDKASSISFNDLIGKKKPKPLVITPELLRDLGSPAAYEQLQKAEALFGNLFWAEQYDLVAALDLVSKTQAQESRTMLKVMLKKAMADHAKNTSSSMFDFTKELVAEEAILARLLNTLIIAADELKNSASANAAAQDVKILHDRRNKDLATLRILSGVVADLLAI